MLLANGGLICRERLEPELVSSEKRQWFSLGQLQLVVSLRIFQASRSICLAAFAARR